MVLVERAKSTTPSLRDVPTRPDATYDKLKEEWFDANHVEAGRQHPGEWLAIGLRVERPGQSWGESAIGLVAHSPDRQEVLDAAARMGLGKAWLVKAPGRPNLLI